VLAAELEAAGTGAEVLPEPHLGRRHLAAEATGAVGCGRDLSPC
jgi:hypothetical protein